MTQFNPLLGGIAATPSAQRAQAADRDAQLRRESIRTRNATYTNGREDEFVESADHVHGVNDEDAHHDPRRKKKRPLPQDAQSKDKPDDGAPSHIDIVA